MRQFRVSYRSRTQGMPLENCKNLFIEFTVSSPSVEQSILDAQRCLFTLFNKTTIAAYEFQLMDCKDA